MRTRSVVFLCSLAGIFVIAASTARADNPPDWLTEAAKVATPVYDVKGVPAVFLKKEESVSVAADGTVIKTDRVALRVLTREGRDYALARVVYETDSEKITDINAWLVRKTGPMKSYGKKETVDMILADNDLYNEARKKFISGYDDADVGDVFGYETVVQSRGIFSQFEFDFQQNLPVVQSGFRLSLPDGWKAEGVTLNRAKIEPAISGNSYNWQLQDLQPIKPESQSPGPDSLAPRLAVSFYPPSGAGSQFRTFANWNDDGTLDERARRPSGDDRRQPCRQGSRTCGGRPDRDGTDQGHREIRSKDPVYIDPNRPRALAADTFRIRRPKFSQSHMATVRTRPI